MNMHAISSLIKSKFTKKPKNSTKQPERKSIYPGVMTFNDRIRAINASNEGGWPVKPCIYGLINPCPCNQELSCAGCVYYNNRTKQIDTADNLPPLIAQGIDKGTSPKDSSSILSVFLDTSKDNESNLGNSVKTHNIGECSKISINSDNAKIEQKQNKVSEITGKTLLEQKLRALLDWNIATDDDVADLTNRMDKIEAKILAIDAINYRLDAIERSTRVKRPKEIKSKTKAKK